MLSPDEQYTANCAVLAGQPGTEGLLHQLRQTVLVNIDLQPGPNGQLCGVAWSKEDQAPVPLCDFPDPQGLACQAMEQFWRPDITVYTMLGVGLGYAVVALARKLLPYQRLVVWDPEPIFLKAMMHAIDIRDAFSGKRVEVYVGGDVQARLEHWYLSLDVTEKLHMGTPIHHGYTGINAPPGQPCYKRAEYTAVHDRIIELVRFHMVGLATWRQFGNQIGDNDILNMPEYFTNPGLTRLKGLWQGKPAVCIAAGPSLQRNLRLLLPAAARRKVALLTCGTTYALVQGLGLQPDVVTTIDFQRLNYTDQFAGIPLDPDCSLVYLHSTHPQTPRRWPGPRFVAENSSDTIGWIRQFAGEQKGDASMVQTVAHLNLIVALMLGANPIILLGQDLSMPLDTHHTPGGRAQDAAPDEAGHEAFLEVPDMYGTPVKTRHSFQSMRMVFERLAVEHPQTTFINASEQGIELRGMRHMPLAEALASLPAPAYVTTEQRPVFQGESSAQLTAREAPPLRALLQDAYRSYVPPTAPELVTAYQQLCDDIEVIGQWARETLAAWAVIEAGTELAPAFLQCVEASDVYSRADTVQQVWALPRYQQLLATEQVLQQHPHATGMFVIRRFDFIELKGEIPPPPEQLQEPWQQARYAASRLKRAAEMFLDELPILQHLLHTTRQRLRPGATIPEALARQQYPRARCMLETLIHTYGRRAHDTVERHGSRLSLIPTMRFWAEMFRQTQQYEAALAFLPADSSHAQRIQQHLARYHADVRHALPAYFAPSTQPIQPTRTAWDVVAVSLGGLPAVEMLLPLSACMRSHAGMSHLNGHVLVPQPIIGG